MIFAVSDFVGHSAGGAGVADSDFVLYVAANEVGYCEHVRDPSFLLIYMARHSDSLAGFAHANTAMLLTIVTEFLRRGTLWRLRGPVL